MPSSPIRLVRNATNEILDTIAGVSTASGISVAKAQTATREVRRCFTIRKVGQQFQN